MGKMIVWNIASLDGYFEGAEPWDLSMHETIWGPELEALSNAQVAEAEALIFGRRTYEGMAAHWTGTTAEPEMITHAMNVLPKIVVSNSLTRADWNNTTIIGGDVVAQLRARKADAEKNLYVFGSADLLTTLLAADLVDEYRLGIAPLLLGAGNPLFKSDEARRSMRIDRVQHLENGGAVLYMTVGKADPTAA